jgi:hypothetical protein
MTGSDDSKPGIKLKPNFVPKLTSMQGGKHPTALKELSKSI